MRPVAQGPKNVLHYLFACRDQVGSHYNTFCCPFHHCLIGPPRNHSVKAGCALTPQWAILTSLSIKIEQPFLAVICILAFQFQSLVARAMISILRRVIPKLLLRKYLFAAFAQPPAAGVWHQRLYTRLFAFLQLVGFMIALIRYNLELLNTQLFLGCNGHD